MPIITKAQITEYLSKLPAATWGDLGNGDKGSTPEDTDPTSTQGDNSTTMNEHATRTMEQTTDTQHASTPANWDPTPIMQEEWDAPLAPSIDVGHAKDHHAGHRL